MKSILFFFSIFFLIGCTLWNENTPSAGVNLSGEINMNRTSNEDYTIDSVDTAFKLLGPDHAIEVGGVPDPKVAGITCFYSRAKKGGITGGLGLATDTSDASVSCRQTGPISFIKPIKKTEEIWNESTSILFKKIRIVRFYDVRSNSLIYLVYSDKLIDGSPKNSISAVALEGRVPNIEK